MSSSQIGKGKKDFETAAGEGKRIMNGHVCCAFSLLFQLHLTSIPSPTLNRIRQLSLLRHRTKQFTISEQASAPEIIRHAPFPLENRSLPTRIH